MVTKLQMRETNDVKYEFKFDHVLILASSSAAPDCQAIFKIHCLLEKRKHQLTKQKADYKTMSGTEWNRNRICSQLFLLHARIF